MKNPKPRKMQKHATAKNQKDTPRMAVSRDESEDDIAQRVQFIEIKKQQIDWYQQEELRYVALQKRYILIMALGIVYALVGWPFAALFSLVALIVALALIPFAIAAACVGFRLWRNATKAATLLQQLANAVTSAVGRKSLSLEKLKEKVLEVETKFLANDDELFTKAFIWQPYLDHLHHLATLEAAGRSTALTWLPRIDIPPTWLKGDALRTNYKDRNMVLTCWGIRRLVRQLWTANSYRVKRDRLAEIGKLARKNPITWERFLRSKKVSKLLKGFKRRSRVAYLTTAAKMRLIEFVNGVLSVREYQVGTEESTLLMAEKNEQIKQYTNEFWKVHRRSIKYYFFEALWLLLIIPFGALALYVGYLGMVVPASLVFFVGAAIVVYGEMLLVTRQMIDLKGKKLMPTLIANLIAIRHSMCVSVLEDGAADKYRKHFKDAEKHFIMTTHELESVKYVQDNLKTKLERKLSDEVFIFSEQKKKQLEAYYKAFHFYRRECMRYGALEALVALMLIPMTVIAVWLGITFDSEELMYVSMIGYFAIFAVSEILMVIRHIRVRARKELYLLLYQELAVLLDDPDKLMDYDKLTELFTRTENSAIEAARLDKMQDVIEHIKGVMAQPLI